MHHIAHLKQAEDLKREWEKALGSAFDLVDNDGNNAVDVDELRRVLRLLRKFDPKLRGGSRKRNQKDAENSETGRRVLVRSWSTKDMSNRAEAEALMRSWGKTESGTCK